MQEVKEAYLSLKKRYKLPDYDKLNFEFEISAIENIDFLLREIKTKIIEKFECYRKILEGILQPDTNSLSSIHECKSFDDNEKKDIIRVYQQIMCLYREADEVLLKGDEKELAKFITKAYENWCKLKPKLIEFINKLKLSWKQESTTEEYLGYLG